jgi:ABC-type dipeptide/oligopeptide/nickel transport system permease subunit
MTSRACPSPNRLQPPSAHHTRSAPTSSAATAVDADGGRADLHRRGADRGGHRHLIIGVPLGLAAAARRGSLLDEVIMRGNDLIFAFPSLVIAILITARYGPSATNAILAIGIFNIPVFARVARGGALPLWTLDYILAARTAGKGAVRISPSTSCPTSLNLLIVQATIQFSLGILAEAALSYVGLGAQPPVPSWGRMLAEAQTMIYTTRCWRSCRGSPSC